MKETIFWSNNAEVSSHTVSLHLFRLVYELFYSCILQNDSLDLKNMFSII